MKVYYTPRALRHVREISVYLREHSPSAARQVARRIRRTINLLGQFPESGHEGMLIGTREFVPRGLPYVIVYRREFGDIQAITVLGIYHGAQLTPGQEAPPDE